MAEILFVTTEADDFAGSASSTTNAAYIDTSYVTTGISAPTTFNNNAPIQFSHTPASNTGTYWCHYRWRQNSGANYSGADGIFQTFVDGSGNIIANIDYLNGLAAAQVVGDTTVTGAYTSLGNNVVKALDVSINMAATNIVVNFYVNGTIVSTATAANTGAKTGCATTIWANNFTGNVTGTMDISEVIITSDIGTLGMRLAELKPQSDGTHTEWTGSYTSLADLDDGTLVTTDTAGLQQSWNPPAYAGAGTSIWGVVVKSKLQTTSTSPSTAKALIRSGATDYLEPGTITPVQGVIANYFSTFETNPATAAVWTTTEIDTVEYGIRSIV